MRADAQRNRDRIVEVAREVRDRVAPYALVAGSLGPYGALLADGWAEDTPEDFVFSVKAPRYITHVRRLRVKLGRYAGVITTIRGSGYRFDAGPDVRYLPADIDRYRA